MFKNPFSFDGRIRRTEYGISYLIYLAISLPFQFITSNDSSTSLPLIVGFFIILIPLMWFMLAQGAKRCHDRGNSGWYQFIPFYALWMLFADSDHGQNEYGPNPKDIGNHNELNDIGKKDI
jgi:uncharacterized membrane protein YhaH (DUF805 family)